ncbi:MAG: ParB/RepB/Spo0J family partition protein [Bacteroidota bacterium]|nr:ParB/RepB/Spo0J family partition protein [Bacteroidota bacterium]
MAAKRQALGKGLNALLTDSSTDITGRNTVPLKNISEIAINDIEANPFQPREKFEEEKLDELVESIKIHGIIQPVTVRKIGYGKYQLISGERRTRASIRAGLKNIPVYVRVADDQQMLEMSLIENIHREDLNPIEIGISYKRLVDECNLKQEDLASRIGKNRSTINNFLRLLKLPDEIQIALQTKKITVGHARSLITIDDKNRQLEILKIILLEKLSVREVEEMVKGKKTSKRPIKKKTTVKKFERFIEIENDLSKKFDTKVRIKSKQGVKGDILIHFKNKKEFEIIASLLNKT